MAKLPHESEETFSFVLDVLLWGMKTSPVAWTFSVEVYG